MLAANLITYQKTMASDYYIKKDTSSLECLQMVIFSTLNKVNISFLEPWILHTRVVLPYDNQLSNHLNLELFWQRAGKFIERKKNKTSLSRFEPAILGWIKVYPSTNRANKTCLNFWSFLLIQLCMPEGETFKLLQNCPQYINADMVQLALWLEPCI